MGFSLDRAKAAVSRLEAWWFDTIHRVETSGYVPLASLSVADRAADCYDYSGSRAATARKALRRLPIRNHRDYAFIDLGSGKGKAMFIASEYPFRRIEGVEFAPELHQYATVNINRFRSFKRRCCRIESVYGNAADYQFPDENLVVFLFNPFGPTVLNAVLSNLEASLDGSPRDVLLLLLHPVLAPWIRRRQRFQPIEETRRFCLYRAENPISD